MTGSQPFHGVRFDGKTHDTGSKLDFLLTDVAFAFEDDEVADTFREGVATLLA